MSPQYNTTTLHPSNALYETTPRPRSSMSKPRDEDDPRYRDMDRVFARRYVQLMKQQIQQRRAGVFVPRMDLCDDHTSPYVTALLEVPGMKVDQLSVRIESGRLIIEGERLGPSLHTSALPSQLVSDAAPPHAASEPHTNRAESAAADDAALAALYPVRELKHGKFRREIQIPPGVTALHVTSILVEGMLTIRWPRMPTQVGNQAQQPAIPLTPVPNTEYPHAGV